MFPWAAFFYAHAVTPSDVPMAVKMVISVWMMIFQISFLLLMMINFKLRIKNYVYPGNSLPGLMDALFNQGF